MSNYIMSHIISLPTRPYASLNLPRQRPLSHLTPPHEAKPAPRQHLKQQS